MNSRGLKTAVLLVTLELALVPLGGASDRVEGLVRPKLQAEIVTVGGPDADIAGYSSRAIQLAIDALRSRGGGTVKLGPGVYQIRGPVELSSHITLQGAGPDTILRKIPGFKTSFVVDADYGMLKVKVSDPSGFKIGDGIQLYDSTHNQGWDVTTARITAIVGNTLYIDSPTVNDYISSDQGTISNACSVVRGEGVEDVKIYDLTVDGDGGTNDYLNGCRGGGVYLFRSRDCVVRRVHVTRFNGDSFSWQITENITVRECEASEGLGLGFHPGTGSDGSNVIANSSHDNVQDGIFLCWRVQNGVFRNNKSYHNGGAGISIGHQDTDNLFVNNHIYENGRHGVYFRNETEQNGGHRNTFRGNLVENNGRAIGDGYGFYIGGNTHDIVIENNIIRDQDQGTQKAAVMIGSKAERVTISENEVAGHPGIVREN